MKKTIIGIIVLFFVASLAHSSEIEFHFKESHKNLMRLKILRINAENVQDYHSFNSLKELNLNGELKRVTVNCTDHNDLTLSLLNQENNDVAIESWQGHGPLLGCGDDLELKSPHSVKSMVVLAGSKHRSGEFSKIFRSEWEDKMSRLDPRVKMEAPSELTLKNMGNFKVKQKMSVKVRGLGKYHGSFAYLISLRTVDQLPKFKVESFEIHVESRFGSSIVKREIKKVLERERSGLENRLNHREYLGHYNKYFYIPRFSTEHKRLEFDIYGVN